MAHARATVVREQERDWELGRRDVRAMALHVHGQPALAMHAPTAAPAVEAKHFQKFDAVCSNCGKKCQVPFRPDGEKPVYCKDCFGVPREAMAGKKKFSCGDSGKLWRPHTLQHSGNG